MSGSHSQFTTIASGGDDSGLLLGRYQFERNLGSGGMGDVILASDTRLPRKVAIKKVKESLSHDEMVRKRIERECALHATVGTHANIVTLYDVIDHDGQLHIVLEYVEGVSLDQMLRDLAARGERLPREDVVSIVSQVLEALSAIHTQSIVHRDIKPANIMVTRNGKTGDVNAKLMDFGIAKEDDEYATQLTATTGTSPGTPYYMAPEQIDPATFGAVTAKTDVYAVGIMMHQMISGEPPFTGTLTEVFNKHLTQTPPPLDLASGREDCADLQGAIQVAISKQPANRFVSAIGMRDAVLGVGEPVNDAQTQEAATMPAGASADPAATLPAGAVTQPATHSDPSRTMPAGSGTDPGSNTGAGQTQWAGDTHPGGTGSSAWPKVAAAAVVVVAGVGAAGFFGMKALSGPAEEVAVEEPAPMEEPAVEMAVETPSLDTQPVIEFGGVGNDPGVENKTGSDASNLLRELRAEREAERASTPEPAPEPAPTVAAAKPETPRAESAPQTKPAEQTASSSRSTKPAAKKPANSKAIADDGTAVGIGERRWANP